MRAFDAIVSFRSTRGRITFLSIADKSRFHSANTPVKRQFFTLSMHVARKSTLGPMRHTEPTLVWAIVPAADKVAAPPNAKAQPFGATGAIVDDVATGDGFMRRTKDGTSVPLVLLMFVEGQTQDRLAGLAKEKGTASARAATPPRTADGPISNRAAARSSTGCRQCRPATRTPTSGEWKLSSSIGWNRSRAGHFLGRNLLLADIMVHRCEGVRETRRTRVHRLPSGDLGVQRAPSRSGGSCAAGQSPTRGTGRCRHDARLATSGDGSARG